MNQVVNFASQLEDLCLQQAEATASMPFIYPHVALMPDAHYGLGSSVGTVFGTKGAVIPAAVGVDIGCGMIGVCTNFTSADLEGRDLVTLRDYIERVIPLSPGNYNSTTLKETAKPKIAELEELAERDGIDLSHSPTWKRQLGSLGGGNHFIEVCLDELDRVWLFLHSGSRGVGNKIAQKHIKIAQAMCAEETLPDKDLAYLTEGTPEFEQYIAELNWAQRFAFLNREEMMDRFAREVEYFVEKRLDQLERINCHHNYTVREEHFGETVWLTRKGAVLADEGTPALIPGSMGTASYVVTGKGNADALRSAPHGAGRRMSRNQAKKRFSTQDLDSRMAGIVYRPGKEWIDEIPDAYKDIDQVMADAADLVTIRHKLRQIVNVKGT
ncbi:hypothetical protein CDES_13590 [Corynebacterium deserti GIMN1.010]|uniref:3'-phosphate/5'-hydroxy nucleic acid ligase n=1 Tax=Corynebacterium deserti GIMN1.010 TaxID=931089 RepID=A0A0M5IGM9_9CORY|nr:RtcB family protein [Corynebacterium deserti]ALC07048.1 hypothetical protein CDES_13590 [Corynebacterium deserti GIMN1.010]